jgi:Lipoate synthase
MGEVLGRRNLHTVCDGARCPNKAECWGMATATFMIMGASCTRFCRFCAVDHRVRGEELRESEPAELAAAAAELGLRYAVVTSVDRDDLPYRGAAHFAACVRALKSLENPPLVELLVPDYREGEVDLVAASGPDVIAHNVETVRRLQGLRDGRASYEASLATLRLASAYPCVVKSSLMLGLGETEAELLSAMGDLREAGCTSLVLGQYLQPTKAQVEVARYVTPEEFARYADEARARGFTSVVSAPLARTSYHARSSFEGCS